MEKNFENLKSSDWTESIKSSSQASWGSFLFQGVILSILGICALFLPQLFSLTINFWIGWLFVFSGILGFVSLFYTQGLSDFLWNLVSDALLMLVGVILLLYPVDGTIALTWILIGFFAVEGIFQIAISLKLKDVLPNWGWLLFSGVIDFVLVYFATEGMPFSSSWMLGLFAGVNLLSTGISIIMVAITAKRAAKALVN